EIVLRIDGLERRCRNAEALEKRLLDEPILGCFQRARRRVNRQALGKELRSADGDVLELVSHGVQAPREALQNGNVFVIADVQFGEMAGGCERRHVEEAEAQAERIAGEGKHSSQLPSAQDADHQDASRGSGWASTPRVCSSRKRSKAARNSGW